MPLPCRQLMRYGQVLCLCTYRNPLSAQQTQHALWHLVGLCHHRRTRLLQDLGSGQVGRFLREVRVHDSPPG